MGRGRAAAGSGNGGVFDAPLFYSTTTRPDLRLRLRLRLRRNYFYGGKGDGLSSLLRKRHGPNVCVRLELELNQHFVQQGGPAWNAVRADVMVALAQAVGRADVRRHPAESRETLKI